MNDAAPGENDDQETGSLNGEVGLAADLPVPEHRSKPSSAGGREDCWSEGATAVLIEAWGERYVGLSRGSLKQKHWEEVAEIVAARAAGEGKPPKTHVQCKYRIDTVKKKYKSEKAKLADAGDGRPSNWPFFDRVEQLLGSPNAFLSATKNSTVVDGSGKDIPVGISVGRSVHRHQPPPTLKQPNHSHLPQRKRPVAVDSGSEDISPESSDSLPPANQDDRGERKRQRTELDCPPLPRPPKFDGAGGRPAAGGGNSVRELTNAILKFGETYEKTERAKLQQVVDIELQRMEFAKDIELQRMEFLVKTQVEISRVGGRSRGAGGRGGNGNDLRINGADESNVNNNTSNNSD